MLDRDIPPEVEGEADGAGEGGRIAGELAGVIVSNTAGSTPHPWITAIARA